MEKIEFKQFCHEEFLKRGFIKKKSMYFAQGKDNLLCSLDLQGAYGDCYFINRAVYIDYPIVKGVYPSFYAFDLSYRFAVLSKATYKGERFMTGLIEYTKYSKEELLPYFERELDAYIVPVLKYGKNELIRNLDIWDFPDPTVKSKECVLAKLYSHSTDLKSE